MTYNTKNTTIVFAFAALLMVMPLANSNAFGDGDANLDPSCGVTTTNIDMGSFSIGADGTEVETSWVTGGAVAGTLEVTAGDWLGVGTLSTGVITLTNVISTDIVTINGLAYTGVASGATEGQFNIGGDDIITATNLASSINADTRTGVTVVAQDLTSESTGNVVIVRATVLGTTGNSIDLVSSDSTMVVDAATLTDAEASGVTHMESTATKYAITTDGTSSTGTSYAGKTALDADTVLKVLTSTVDPAQNVRISMHISGDGTLINLPYSGALTQTLSFTVTCV